MVQFSRTISPGQVSLEMLTFAPGYKRTYEALVFGFKKKLTHLTLVESNVLTRQTSENNKSTALCKSKDRSTLQMRLDCSDSKSVSKTGSNLSESSSSAVCVLEKGPDKTLDFVVREGEC